MRLEVRPAIMRDLLRRRILTNHPGNDRFLPRPTAPRTGGHGVSWPEHLTADSPPSVLGNEVVLVQPAAAGGQFASLQPSEHTPICELKLPVAMPCSIHTYVAGPVREGFEISVPSALPATNRDTGLAVVGTEGQFGIVWGVGDALFAMVVDARSGIIQLPSAQQVQVFAYAQEGAVTPAGTPLVTAGAIIRPNYATGAFHSFTQRIEFPANFVGPFFQITPPWARTQTVLTHGIPLQVRSAHVGNGFTLDDSASRFIDTPALSGPVVSAQPVLRETVGGQQSLRFDGFNVAATGVAEVKYEVAA